MAIGMNPRQPGTAIFARASQFQIAGIFPMDKSPRTNHKLERKIERTIKINA